MTSTKYHRQPVISRGFSSAPEDNDFFDASMSEPKAAPRSGWPSSLESSLTSVVELVTPVTTGDATSPGIAKAIDFNAGGGDLYLSKLHDVRDIAI